MKKILLTYCLISFFVINLKGQTYDSFYGGIVNQSNSDSIHNYLVQFENLGVKEPGTVPLLNTLNWLIQKYSDYGYTDISIDTFTYSGFEVYNLIVSKTGTHYPNSYVIVDGHYDTKTGTGTNDNGSGTAIILETARLLKDVATEHSIKFVHFSMEEVGLIGSSHYVNNIVEPSGMTIRILLNIDEVGGVNGMTNNTIVCERDESSPTAANAASAAFTDTLATCVELYSNLQAEISYAYASDYMPFQAKDYVITGLFEKNYSPYAHTSNDVLSNMDEPYVFEITKAAIGATLEFAVAYNDIGIDEINQMNIKIYPNPASNYLYLSGKDLELPLNYILINALGQTIHEGNVTHNGYISVNSIPNGLYQLVLKGDTFNYSTKIMIKRSL